MNSALLQATLSQALQATLPVAVALAWVTRRGHRAAGAGLRAGILAAVPVTIVATTIFRTSAHQARDEAALAVAALCIAAYFVRLAWREVEAVSASGANPLVPRFERPLSRAAGPPLLLRPSMGGGVVVLAAAIG